MNANLAVRDELLQYLHALGAAQAIAT